MCTMIGASTPISGSARSADAWREVDEARITYDHATRIWTDHAVRLDLSAPGAVACVAVELDLASAKALAARLQEVIAAADRAEGS